jgi:hypothetical protein
VTLWLGLMLCEEIPPRGTSLPPSSALSNELALRIHTSDQQVDSGTVLDGESALQSPFRLHAPWSSVVVPGANAIASSKTPAERAKSLLELLVVLSIWSLFGAALCRRAAVAVAIDEPASVRRSLRYAGSRWRSTLGAPLIPLLAAGCLLAFLLTVGLLGRVPVIGSGLLAVMSPVLLVCAAAVGFLLMMTAICWPIMVAAIATDGCDGFGGLSRAYSLVTGRPWYAVWSVIVAAFIGVALYSLSALLVELALYFEVQVTSFAAGENLSHSPLAAVSLWIARVGLSGLANGYFWSSTTLMYLLLRQSVDGMPLDRNAPDDEDRQPNDPLPVVGMPAVDASPLAPNENSATACST